jgi:hypothetical protein
MLNECYPYLECEEGGAEDEGGEDGDILMLTEC